MFKYYCLNPISGVGLEKFTDNYAKTEDINEAEGILVRSAAMHDMELPENLLAVARAGAGVNNIPLDRCAEKGIVVFNTPGANANGVKELVIAGMLLASRDVVGGINWVESAKDDENIAKTAEKEKKRFVGTELEGKKLGIIGLGAIGVMVANAANHLGMTVYGYDPYLSVNSAWNLTHNAVHIYDINEIYKKCDYISIHVPLTDTTKNMINADAIANMKDGVRILNFARAALVNSDDMLTALQNGKVAAYVTDFPTDEMLCVDGVIAIPHLGASTPESEDNCADMAARQLIDYIENGNITNSVNMPAISMPRSGNHRVCVIHKNIPNMLTAITGIVAENNVNIENMLNKSRGDYAYTMIDINVDDASTVEKRISDVDGVIKVRVI